MIDVVGPRHATPELLAELLVEMVLHAKVEPRALLAAVRALVTERGVSIHHNTGHWGTAVQISARRGHRDLCLFLVGTASV